MAAAAVGVHLIRVDVEAAKKPEPGVWVRATAQECSCVSWTTPERRVGTESQAGPQGRAPPLPALADLPSSQAVSGVSAFAFADVMEVGCWLRLPDWVGCCLGPETCSWMGQAPSSGPSPV